MTLAHYGYKRVRLFIDFAEVLRKGEGCFLPNIDMLHKSTTRLEDFIFANIDGDRFINFGGVHSRVIFLLGNFGYLGKKCIWFADMPAEIGYDLDLKCGTAYFVHIENITPSKEQTEDGSDDNIVWTCRNYYNDIIDFGYGINLSNEGILDCDRTSLFVSDWDLPYMEKLWRRCVDVIISGSIKKNWATYAEAFNKYFLETDAEKKESLVRELDEMLMQESIWSRKQECNYHITEVIEYIKENLKKGY